MKGSNRNSVTSSLTTTMSSPNETEKEVTSEGLALSRTASEPVYPPMRQAMVILLALYGTMFLVALDRLIIGTAIPTITDQFDSLSDVGWYGSSYLLTSCAFSLFMGRIYTFYNAKWVFIICVVVFEIGSAVSGAAPSSTALIIGRAVAGLGNAGIFQGAIIIFCHILPLHKRPMYIGFAGMVFGVASAAGPLLGGVFTDEVSWRWCFYINLPIGGVAIAVLTFFLSIPGSLAPKPKTFKEQLNSLDPVGTIVFLPCIVCLLLALQYGGVTYAWSNFRPILLLTLFGVLLVVFCVIQYIKGETATIPSSIIRNRSILSGMWYTFFNGGSMIVAFYFIPIWFQAIKSASAVKSGIMNLPTVLSLVIASVICGILVRKIGYYTPFLIFSSIVAPIGIGLITTFTPTTNHAHWIGYQFLFGFGLGCGMQQSNVAAQTVLPRKDVPTGVSLMFFFQTLGGAVFLSVANNLFNSHLVQGFQTIPGLDANQLATVGATDLRGVVPSQSWGAVEAVYNAAIRQAFIVSLALSCMTVVGALTMEWKSVKAEHQKQKAKQQQQQQQQQEQEQQASESDEAKVTSSSEEKTTVTKEDV